MDNVPGHTKRAVPTFASFRPLPVQEKDDQIRRLDKEEIYVPSQKPKHHRSRGEESRPSKHGRRRDDNTQKEIDLSRSASLKSSVKTSRCQEQATGNYTVDRVGDPANVTYGSLDRYSTPTYYRSGGGKVIGVASSQRIDRDASTEKQLIISNKQGSLADSDRPLRNAETRKWKDATWTKPIEFSKNSDDTEDFLLLDRRKKRRESEASASSVSSAEQDGNLEQRSSKPRSRSRMRVPGFKTRDDVNHGDNEDTEDSRQIVRHKRVDLTKKVESNPSDGEAWLQLLQLQDALLGPNPTSAELTSTADIKVSLAQRALTSVHKRVLKEKLALQLMQEANKIWESSKLLQEWEKILQKLPDSFLLWKAYLDFRQGDFTSYKHQAFENVCSDCLRMLEQAVAKARQATESSQIFRIQVFVILRISLYYRESGYAEHSTAIWQAVLEYNFLSPPQLRQTEYLAGGSKREMKVALFEKFWESEVARIGDENAQGWMTLTESLKDVPEPKIAVESANPGNDPYVSWLNLEDSKSVALLYPARTLDETAEDDPFRVVLFPDIQSYLISAPDEGSRSLLIQAFLLFSQMPVESNSSARLWSRDGRACTSAIATGKTSPTSDRNDPLDLEKFGSTVDINTFMFSSNQSFDDYYLDDSTLFAKPRSWFCAFRHTCERDAGQQHDKIMWVLRSLKLIANSSPTDEALAEYTLTLEASCSMEMARKTAKAVLKKRPSSLRLYNAYALIEYAMGKHDRGELALVTALNIGKSAKSCQLEDRIHLWRTWVWEMMSNGQNERAFYQLQSFDDEVVRAESNETLRKLPTLLNPSKLIRSRLSLESFRDHMLTSQRLHHASIAMECLILLAYLQDTTTMEASISTFEANVSLLSRHTRIPKSRNTGSLELLHQSMARLLYHHSTHNNLFKPSENRDLLANSISLFPQNTIFLSLYACNESRFRIHDRLRSILDSVVLSHKNRLDPDNNPKLPKDDDLTISADDTSESIRTYFFAITSELSRAAAGGGSNTHTIRATFERAVQSETGSHCPGLWKSYFLWEVDNLARCLPPADVYVVDRGGRDSNKKKTIPREQKPQREAFDRARTVFYRAVKACPWSKEIYLFAFRYLRPGSVGGDHDDAVGMANRELRGIYDLMQAKELRVRVELDEVIGEK